MRAACCTGAGRAAGAGLAAAGRVAGAGLAAGAGVAAGFATATCFFAQAQANTQSAVIVSTFIYRSFIRNSSL